VQRLGRCFRSERLADPRRSVQQKDEAVALALDDVSIDPALVVDQQLQFLLLRRGHHHLVDARGVEADRLQRFHTQLAPLFRSETEPVHARLAVFVLLIFEVFDLLAVLPPRLVRVDFTERTLVDHDAPRRAQLEGRLPAPREFDEVARILELRHFVRVLLEQLASFMVLRHLFRGRFDYFKVFTQFELVEFIHFEPLVLPDEFLAVELDDVRSNPEELALAILNLSRAGYFGNHGPALVGTKDVVPGQELILQVVLKQYA